MAATAEDLGFGGAWIADSQSIFRDAFSALTLCAVRTRQIRLATGVTNPVTRHPAVLASSIATLDELSGGRAVLGLGVGESAVRTLGLKPARLSEVEEVTQAIRSLLQGEPASYHGKEIRLTWPRRKVPIYFASSGPKSLQLAGRVADGVLFQVGSDLTMIRYAIKQIELGAAQGGRSLDAIRLWVRLACSVADDREVAREEIRGYAAAAAGTVFASVPRNDIPQDLWAEMQQMKSQYNYYEHASSAAQHRRLVTDRIVDAMAVAGTAAEAIPRLKEIAALGVAGFVIPLTTSDPQELMRTLAERVMPYVC